MVLWPESWQNENTNMQNQLDPSLTKIHYIIRAETFQRGHEQLTENATSLVQLKQIHVYAETWKILQFITTG